MQMIDHTSIGISPGGPSPTLTWSGVSGETNYSTDYQNVGALQPYRYSVVMTVGDVYTSIVPGKSVDSSDATIGNSALYTTIYVKGYEIATESNGVSTTFDDISFDGINWFLIDSSDIKSFQQGNYSPTLNNGALQYNSFNSNGQIIWQATNSKYSSIISQAASRWNSLLGKTVFVQATTSTLSSSITLAFSDTSSDTDSSMGVNVLADYNPGSESSSGNIRINLHQVGQGNYSTNATIENVIGHEMGHALGLDHTTAGVNISTNWAFAPSTDIMSMYNSGDGTTSLTTTAVNDLNTVDMEIANHNFYNTRPVGVSDSFPLMGSVN